MTIMNESIEKRTDQLLKIFHEIKQLDEEELSHLYELVRLHNESLFIVGDLASLALYERDVAYSERKRVHAEIVLGETGTVAVKEATAEIAIAELRQRESEANSTYKKYDLMYQSLNHRLIDYRQKRNKLEDELKLINDRG